MRRVLRRRYQSVVAILAVTAIVSPIAVAHATKRKPDRSPSVHFSNPILAVVSLKDQRISLYDANGVALRARVSTGQPGLETPSGVYAVLEKDIDHHSNVYDDAAMPFMQRITWSGIALHAGVLPGHPASHGCVRMPYSFARQIFPLTRLGMRVVISPDDFAPVPISHPFLLEPSLPDLRVVTPTSFARQGTDTDNAFLPDVRKWPERAAELAAVKSIADSAATALQKAIAQAAKSKSVFDRASESQIKAAKALRSANIARRSANDQLERAVRKLEAAKIPRSTKSAAEAKAKALARSQRAGQAVEDARAAVEVALNQLATAKTDFGISADNSPGRRETTRKQTKKLEKAKKLLGAAERAKRKANDRVADADRALFAASQPRPTERAEDAKSKALTAVANADTKYATAADRAQEVDGRFAEVKNEYDATESARTAAAANAKEWVLRTKPLSIFVSLKMQRLYVRQAHAPVLELPITIADPSKPIGTHVFTAVDYANDGNSLRWTVVSIGRADASIADENRSANLNANALPTNPNAALAALDRLTMPPEILKLISGYVWPGSSLIVSDEAMSDETGVATDFVVVMSGEPQGGLKSRIAEVAASRRNSLAARNKRKYNDDYYDDRRRSRRYLPEQSSFFTFW